MPEKTYHDGLNGPEFNSDREICTGRSKTGDENTDAEQMRWIEVNEGEQEECVLFLGKSHQEVPASGWLLFGAGWLLW